uniref:V-SNARE coiled-coil homology domain-containing protein n=1 Tax=Acrobeloides nanus TaxID=290746 RepID=A0A914E9K6_9BILA
MPSCSEKIIRLQKECDELTEQYKVISNKIIERHKKMEEKLLESSESLNKAAYSFQKTSSKQKFRQRLRYWKNKTIKSLCCCCFTVSH